MCPDRQIVSLYLDGELPSPWREKMEAHLGSCPQCSCALAKYRTLGNIFPQPQAQVIEDAQGRVWKEIAALDQFSVRRSVVQPEAKHNESGGRSSRRTLWLARRAWNRRVTLPLPAAAAAALALFVVFFALIGQGGATFAQNNLQAQVLTHDPAAAVNIGIEDYSLIPIHDMNDVIRHFSTQGNMDFMIIRLPEHRSFSSPGQPMLINASDYSMARRNFPR